MSIFLWFVLQTCLLFIFFDTAAVGSAADDSSIVSFVAAVNAGLVDSGVVAADDGQLISEMPVADSGSISIVAANDGCTASLSDYHAVVVSGVPLLSTKPADDAENIYVVAADNVFDAGPVASCIMAADDEQLISELPAVDSAANDVSTTGLFESCAVATDIVNLGSAMPSFVSNSVSVMTVDVKDQGYDPLFPSMQPLTNFDIVDSNLLVENLNRYTLPVSMSSVVKHLEVDNEKFIARKNKGTEGNQSRMSHKKMIQAKTEIDRKATVISRKRKHTSDEIGENPRKIKCSKTESKITSVPKILESSDSVVFKLRDISNLLNKENLDALVPKCPPHLRARLQPNIDRYGRQSVQHRAFCGLYILVTFGVWPSISQ